MSPTPVAPITPAMTVRSPGADKVDYGQPEGGTSMSSQTPGDLWTAVLWHPR
jgi:hypothetical protein